MLHKVRLNDKTMEKRDETTLENKINQFENILIEMHYAFICHRIVHDYTHTAICEQNHTDNI